MNKFLYVLWPIIIFLGGISLCILKPASISWLTLGLATLLVLGITALIAAVLLPFRGNFLSDTFYGGVVSATLSGGIIGMILILLTKVFGA